MKAPVTRPRRTTPPPEAQPWYPPAYTPADVHALKALRAGEATPDQQRRAVDWLIHKAAATYDQSFRPGSDGDRATVFAEGRRFVGLQMVKLINLSAAALEAMRKVKDARPAEQ